MLTLRGDFVRGTAVLNLSHHRCRQRQKTQTKSRTFLLHRRQSRQDAPSMRMQRAPAGERQSLPPPDRRPSNRREREHG